jgi:hypothetical protein
MVSQSVFVDGRLIKADDRSILTLVLSRQREWRVKADPQHGARRKVKQTAHFGNE